jgi:hypothetical protein
VNGPALKKGNIWELLSREVCTMEHTLLSPKKIKLLRK